MRKLTTPVLVLVALFVGFMLGGEKSSPIDIANAQRAAAPDVRDQAVVRDHRNERVRDNRKGRVGTCAPGDSAVSFADVQSRLTGRAGGGDDKADDVQGLRPPLAPPGNPSGAPLQWINSHNNGLRAIINQVFSAQDMNAFGAAERNACGSNVYCTMTYREQAIALIVQR